MKLEPFGITETYEPAYDFSWVDNLKIGNVLITKYLTDKFIDILCEPIVRSKCILHLTVTGMGNTMMEEFVPSIEISVNQLKKLLNKGFPKNQIVLCLSPIIPTVEGINDAIKVLDAFKDFGIRRIRFSTLNMYNHVKRRFLNNNIPLPYLTYSCPQYMRDNLMNAMLNYFNVTTNESWDSDICAEIDLDEGLILKRACVSQKDLQILNIEDKIKFVGSGKQRSSCMCPDNKKQIIRRRPGQCRHNCLYCYWKTKS